MHNQEVFIVGCKRNVIVRICRILKDSIDLAAEHSIGYAKVSQVDGGFLWANGFIPRTDKGDQDVY